MADQPKEKKWYLNRNVRINKQYLPKDSVCPANCLVELQSYGYVSEKKEKVEPIGEIAKPVGNPGKISASEKPTEEKE